MRIGANHLMISSRQRGAPCRSRADRPTAPFSSAPRARSPSRRPRSIGRPGCRRGLNGKPAAAPRTPRTPCGAAGLRVRGGPDPQRRRDIMDTRSNLGCASVWACKASRVAGLWPTLVTELRVVKASFHCLAGERGRFGIGVCAGFSAIAVPRWCSLEMSCRPNHLVASPAARPVRLPLPRMLDRSAPASTLARLAH